jgi:hypothetical protein
MLAPTQSIDQLYAKQLEPLLDNLEARRLKVRRHALVTLAQVGAAALICAVMALLLLPPDWRFPSVFVLFTLSTIVFGWRTSATWNAYRNEFKHEVIGRLVQLVDPELQYNPSGGIQRSEFTDSGIYRRRIDRYNAEDLFYGRIGATDLRFSEVHAQYRQTTGSGKNRRTRYVTIFRGIFFIADFHKHFSGATYVLPSSGGDWGGGIFDTLRDWGHALSGRPGEPVRLEDPTFERSFDVHSTDQVEARYILSMSMMQRLVEFRNKLNTPIALAFVNSLIYIAIPTRKNHFEPPSMWAGSARLNQDEVVAYLEDVRLAEEIVVDLNLNTRIWSKQ